MIELRSFTSEPVQAQLLPVGENTVRIQDIAIVLDRHMDLKGTVKTEEQYRAPCLK